MSNLIACFLCAHSTLQYSIELTSQTPIEPLSARLRRLTSCFRFNKLQQVSLRLVFDLALKKRIPSK